MKEKENQSERASERKKGRVKKGRKSEQAKERASERASERVKEKERAEERKAMFQRDSGRGWTDCCHTAPQGILGKSSFILKVFQCPSCY